MAPSSCGNEGAIVVTFPGFSILRENCTFELPKLSPPIQAQIMKGLSNYFMRGGLFAAFCLLAVFGFGQNQIVGVWKTIDDETNKAKSLVEIYEQDGKLYGKVIKLFREPSEDDTPDNLRLLSAILAAHGYEVRKALSGRMALTACQMMLPDIVLLDINMPQMSGYEVCRQLKADERTNDVPIIFISALDDVLDKVKAFDLGGVDYITKPFHRAEVVLRVENQINLRLLQVRLKEKNFLLQEALNNLKAAQAQKIQDEKMVALGNMVAGIAHEVNNPISFIYGNLEYTSEYVRQLVTVVEEYQRAYPQPTPKIQQLAEEIDLNFITTDLQKLTAAMNRGAERIRSIVIALQNFSRHEQSNLKSVDIHKGIDSTLMMLQHRLQETKHRSSIAVMKKYGKLPLIYCYASELNQVFMHLLNNAIDALDDKSEIYPSENPQIKITTETVAPLSVKISIADNGLGIKENARSQLFDPFFTTKPVGKGSGLGLSISHQIIVQKHQGKINFSSSEQGGTEFFIEIPIKLPN
ncbi:MAG: response regulator [Bacteroidota bacterium]